MKMSKDAKMLFISLGLFFIACVVIIFNSQQDCRTIEYQDLNGTHSQYECHDKKPATCWDKYATEDLAIQMCEGE
jgi:hypothetical protein